MCLCEWFNAKCVCFSNEETAVWYDLRNKEIRLKAEQWVPRRNVCYTPRQTQEKLLEMPLLILSINLKLQKKKRSP